MSILDSIVKLTLLRSSTNYDLANETFAPNCNADYYMCPMSYVKAVQPDLMVQCDRWNTFLAAINFPDSSISLTSTGRPTWS